MRSKRNSFQIDVDQIQVLNPWANNGCTFKFKTKRIPFIQLHKLLLSEKSSSMNLRQFTNPDVQDDAGQSITHCGIIKLDPGLSHLNIKI